VHLILSKAPECSRLGAGDGKGLSLAQTESFCPSLRTDAALTRSERIRTQLSASGLYADPALSFSEGQAGFFHATTSWRISPCPFLISKEQLAFFTALGPHLLAFYRALNRLYSESVKGAQPAWAAGYLDQGKPEALVTFSRMKRFREQIPAVIRPDVIPTQDGMIITELDSVPGGIGLTACLSQIYSSMDRGHLQFVGGPDGMLLGFAAMLRSAQGGRAGCAALVVSEEAKEYRPEMTWLAARLREQGAQVYCVEPRDIRFTEEGLRVRTEAGEEPVGLLYRFYELFDLMNIPKAELIQYAAKKDLVAVTPPYKPALEEKSAFALLHHPVLQPFWERELGADGLLHMTAMMPRTWLLDPAPIPPSATIPGLRIGGRAVASWNDLEAATQKERHLVVKPSGFSELAWGSRGVSVGHDLPQTEWAGALRNALASFPSTPYVLQEFHKGRLFEMDYLDTTSSRTMLRLSGRVRLSPYYFVIDGTVELAGILATLCSADKKIIHGMRDAVMVPCAVQSD
jgi:hypothetical protein